MEYIEPQSLRESSLSDQPPQPANIFFFLLKLTCVCNLTNLIETFFFLGQNHYALLNRLLICLNEPKLLFYNINGIRASSFPLLLACLNNSTLDAKQHYSPLKKLISISTSCLRSILYGPRVKVTCGGQKETLSCQL